MRTRNHCADLLLRTRPQHIQCFFLSESMHGTHHTYCAPLIHHSSSIHILHLDNKVTNTTYLAFPFDIHLQTLNVRAKFACVFEVSIDAKAFAPPLSNQHSNGSIQSVRQPSTPPQRQQNQLLPSPPSDWRPSTPSHLWQRNQTTLRCQSLDCCRQTLLLQNLICGNAFSLMLPALCKP